MLLLFLLQMLLISNAFIHSTNTFYSRCNVSLSKTSIKKTLSSLYTSSASCTDPESSSSLPSFYDRLNRPKSVAAPMVAQSDLAFRKLCRKHGTELTYTQMIHSKNFCISKTFQDTHLDVYNCNDVGKNSVINLQPSQSDAIQINQNDELIQHHSLSNYEENGPVIVQLAGHDPPTMVNAAKIICETTQEGIAGIDVNLGCPQTIARKGNYGAFLMHQDFDLVVEILGELRSALPSHIGISAKIRLPMPLIGKSVQSQEEQLQQQVERLIVESGINLLTIHGRTLEENKTKVRNCNWEMIQKASEVTKQYNIPLIANGGIEHPSDISKCLQQTQAQAVMSSEALLENPGIFALDAKDESEMSAREIFDRQIQFSMQYLDLALLNPPLPGSLGKECGSFNVVRAHLFKFLYRYLEQCPDLRSRLGDKSKDMRRIIHAKHLVHELKERHANISEDELKNKYKDSPSWYRRHRNSISLSHTRGAKESMENLTIEEKKKRMLERIKQLKAQKEQRRLQNI